MHLSENNGGRRELHLGRKEETWGTSKYGHVRGGGERYEVRSNAARTLGKEGHSKRNYGAMEQLRTDQVPKKMVGGREERKGPHESRGVQKNDANGRGQWTEGVLLACRKCAGWSIKGSWMLPQGRAWGEKRGEKTEKVGCTLRRNPICEERKGAWMMEKWWTQLRIRSYTREERGERKIWEKKGRWTERD